ncbi:MAG: hypothetical protein A3H69_04185 [Candidatus Sungbacteria bacterium RIFCSPLOWO2_02_FULL_47_9]|uniref:UPF0235 protein A3A32_03430 n=2 Tax=Parcubacteria group TaxID=1794811 RepID=A0A1G2RPU1_9BACT|nr:MAG: hypothetical protein UX72_C0003G0079 [Parcubacteria group bacterium GW2011_GWA2_47_10]OGZ94011.1 MAG: hypothetical protein A2633_01045 [Candidatus Sungbacteria bacterium RIFCSPHIGHO2_01_FULL_47_32]OHA11017.1 MAG: hypothetical protein A3H69_04185 [Candidatus Sungbacteria bacterium RIFCSPLOWO2_02_FULL_47_9]OHA74874.1 MAG: hypothetical protein A3A32_03430 [Candidatus Wildermuthbacteria bacterium RIFCSPLOWO2_01_FULL_48_35]
MKIRVRAKLHSSRERVEKIDNGEYAVFVSKPPVDGKANEAIIELLAEYFSLPKSRIVIRSGHKARTKVVEIG